MTNISVLKHSLRKVLREAMFNSGFAGWSSNEDGPAEVNSNVDPSVAVTDPINPNFTPQNKIEFGVAVQQMVKNLPDTDMPELFNTLKTTIDDNRKAEDEEEMKNNAKQGGTDQVEERLRKIIRQALMEAKPVDWSKLPAPTGPLPPVKKIPAGVHGGEYSRWQEKQRNDVKKYLGKNKLDEPEVVDAPESGEPSEPNLADDSQETEVPSSQPAKRRAYKTTAIGGMSDVQGASFEQIAKELGFSVAGAKQAVDKALEKAQWLAQGIEGDDLEILVLTALNDYVKYLTKSGELTPADIQLMKGHPDIVRELDGFREFLHSAIRKARKAGQRLANPLDDDSMLATNDPDDDEEDVELSPDTVRGDGLSPDTVRGHSMDVDASPATVRDAPSTVRTPPVGRAAKTSYKIYPGSKKYGGKPVVTRVKGKVYGPSGETQFKPNEQGEMSLGDDGKLSVKKPGSDHTQVWDYVEESGSPRHDALVREALRKLL